MEDGRAEIVARLRRLNSLISERNKIEHQIKQLYAPKSDYVPLHEQPLGPVTPARIAQKKLKTSPEKKCKVIKKSKKLSKKKAPVRIKEDKQQPTMDELAELRITKQKLEKLLKVRDTPKQYSSTPAQTGSSLLVAGRERRNQILDRQFDLVERHDYILMRNFFRSWANRWYRSAMMRMKAMIHMKRDRVVEKEKPQKRRANYESASSDLELFFEDEEHIKSSHIASESPIPASTEPSEEEVCIIEERAVDEDESTVSFDPDKKNDGSEEIFDFGNEEESEQEIKKETRRVTMIIPEFYVKRKEEELAKRKEAEKNKFSLDSIPTVEPESHKKDESLPVDVSDQGELFSGELSQDLIVSGELDGSFSGDFVDLPSIEGNADRVVSDEDLSLDDFMYSPPAASA